jgi:hypothetical protein
MVRFKLPDGDPKIQTLIIWLVSDGIIVRPVVKESYCSVCGGAVPVPFRTAAKRGGLAGLRGVQHS